MKAYKQLVAHVLENGTRYETNKGACIGVIGVQVTYDISQGLPIVTGKKTNILWAIAEYAMFLKGITHVDFLRQYNGAEKIWEGQGLSQDLIVKDRNRNPVAVIEDYAKATGIDLKEAEAFFKVALDVAAKQEFIQDGEKSVLFSTHITTDLERITDYITYLENGRVIYTGDMDGLMQKYYLIKGEPAKLTNELKKDILGIRSTTIGFEGLVETKLAHKYKGYIFI